MLPPVVGLAPEQSAPWYRSSHGCSSNQPLGQLSPVLGGGVAVGIGQGRPVIRADGVRLDEDEVPVRFGVVGEPERQRRVVVGLRPR